MRMKIKKEHDHECSGSCRGHSTYLSEEELELATSVPMPKKLVVRLKYVLDKIEADLAEGQRYMYAGIGFIAFQIVAVFFLPVVYSFIGFLGWIIMYLLYSHHTKDSKRDTGFIDGVLFGQAMFAEGLKDFEEEVSSGRKKVPDEIKKIILDKDYKMNSDNS